MDSVRMDLMGFVRLAAALVLPFLTPACGAQEPPPPAPRSICDGIAQSPPSYGARIASIACAENLLWYGAFIDAQGRLASMTVAEGERLLLRDGTTPAWQRVAQYWKGSGLLPQMTYFPGAADCSTGAGGHQQSASCRAFLSDTPWSAAFVSYVVGRAGVPGFYPSASHIDYVRDAYLQPERSPYRLADPDSTAPGAGDLMCFSRGRNELGPAGFRQFLATGTGNGLNMHCDIVVAANPGGDGRLYLVGGNVLQGVTMRVLPLNRNGMVWGLPRRIADAASCRPDSEGACSFNRQDWVALMKLKPLPPPAGTMPAPGLQQPQCCTQCPLPMPAHLRRCPVLQRPVDAPPGEG